LIDDWTGGDFTLRTFSQEASARTLKEKLVNTGIAVAPERLREISKKLSAGTMEIDAILHGVANEITSVQTEWAGPARSQFETLWERLQTDASGLRSVLHGIAKLTQEAAKAYEAAEEAIAKSFSEMRVELEKSTDQLGQVLQVPATTTHEDVESASVPGVDDTRVEENGPRQGEPKTAEARQPSWGFGKELATRAGRKSLQ
jgi:WXG100 family type VII secretion target